MAKLTVTWQGQTLSSVLDRIASSQGVDIWLDRRLDPQQEVNAQFTDMALADVLDKVLSEIGAGWSAWDEMIYVGPADSARELQTLIAIARKSVDKLPASRRRAWLSTEPASWPRLSDPRNLLSGWLESAGISVKNMNALPHDLWDSRELPSQPLVDRVVLLLAGFDMTCRLAASGSSLEIVPIRRPVLVTQQYYPGSRMRELLAAFRDEPGVSVNRQNERVAITGRWEDQQLAQRIVNGLPRDRQTARAARQPAQMKRFSLKLTNQPVGRVVEQLASQLGIAVVWDNAAAEQRDELISCEVHEVSLDELLKNILGPAGLKHSLARDQLTIVPGQ